MARCEFNRRSLTRQEFSFGALRWRSTSVHAVEEFNSDSVNTPQTFVVRLHALIHQALREGCTPAELNTILSQHTLGDSHVDA